MTEFVASNGIHVYLDEYGGIQWDGSIHGERKQNVTQAFREFFLAERDAELGRWRSKEHPECVVYPRSKNRVEVLDERDCVACTFNDSDGLRRNPTEHAEVAREFFAAHPEPKPWHDAKPGDVWALTDDGLTFAASFDGETWRHTMTNAEVLTVDVTAGRRIWPEVSA